MSKSALIGGGSNAATFVSANNVTRYLILGGGTNSITKSTESNTQIVWRQAGTFSRATLNITANARITNTTYRLRINGANGNQNIVIAGGVTGQLVDTTNSDTVAADDLVNYSTTSLGSGGALTSSGRVIGFQASGTHGYMSVFDCDGGIVGPTTTRYVAISGGNLTGTEATVQATVGFAGAMHNLGAWVSSNTLTLASVNVRTRINGSNGNMLVTFGPGVTGRLYDTTNSDSFAQGDIVNLSIAGNSGGGSGSAGFEHTVIETRPTASTNFDISASYTFTSTVGTPVYLRPFGRPNAGSTEAQAQIRSPLAFTWSRLRMRLSAAGHSNTFDFRSRINGADGNQVVSYAVGVRGVLTDATNSDSVAVGDDINYAGLVAGGGTVSTQQVEWIASTGATASALDTSVRNDTGRSTGFNTGRDTGRSTGAATGNNTDQDSPPTGVNTDIETGQNTDIDGPPTGIDTGLNTGLPFSAGQGRFASVVVVVTH